MTGYDFYMECKDQRDSQTSDTTAAAPLRVLAAVSDLLFVSKISAAAKQSASTAQFFRDAAALKAAVPGEPCLIVVDLHNAQLDPIALIASLKQDPATAHAPVVAYLSHVRVDLKREAEKGGADLVLPRSVFSQNLIEMLRRRSCHL
jgi:CheY-like chemotaxis protein